VSATVRSKREELSVAARGDEAEPAVLGRGGGGQEAPGGGDGARADREPAPRGAVPVDGARGGAAGDEGQHGSTVAAAVHGAMEEASRQIRSVNGHGKLKLVHLIPVRKIKKTTKITGL